MELAQIKENLDEIVDDLRRAYWYEIEDIMQALEQLSDDIGDQLLEDQEEHLR